MPLSREQTDWLAQCRDDAKAEVRRTLYRQCSGRDVGQDDIEDLSSDTIRDAYMWLQDRTAGEIDEAHLRNSVRVIAKRRALNWYYRGHRRNRLFDEFRDIIQDHFHQRQDDRQTLDRLDDVFSFARDVLDEDEIRMIRMKYMDVQSHEEIATTLGITPANSRARLSRAIKKLHARITTPIRGDSLRRAIEDGTMDDMSVLEGTAPNSSVVDWDSLDSTPRARSIHKSIKESVRFHRSVVRGTSEPDEPDAIAPLDGDEVVLEELLALFGKLTLSQG